MFPLAVYKSFNGCVCVCVYIRRVAQLPKRAVWPAIKRNEISSKPVTGTSSDVCSGSSVMLLSKPSCKVAS